MRFACVSNVLPVKISFLSPIKILLLPPIKILLPAKFEGEVFAAVPKSCGCVKNCSKLLPSSSFCDVKKLMVDVCETGAAMLLGVSAILPEVSGFPDVNRLVAVNSALISNGFCSGNKTS